MLWSLALVAVRQQEHQRWFLAPLGAGGRQELVDDDLRAVGEVAELGLPQDQRLWCVDAVAVLESQAGVLRERTVVDAERGLCLGHVNRAAYAWRRSWHRGAPGDAG